MHILRALIMFDWKSESRKHQLHYFLTTHFKVPTNSIMYHKMKAMIYVHEPLINQIAFEPQDNLAFILRK